MSHNNEEKDFVRLIISDLHLGSAHAQEEKIFNLLNYTEYDELILAGDIVEFLRKPVFTDNTHRIFDLILKREKPVIYIVGNHDDALKSFVGARLDNITFVRSYDFQYDGRTFRVQHGDEYDSGIVKWRYTIEFISFIQNMLERVFGIDLTTWWANRAIKKRKLKRLWDIVKWNEKADVFIMGHTHNPEVLIWVDKDEKIKTYINTGDWVSSCTYVLIKGGQVRLRNYHRYYEKMIK